MKVKIEKKLVGYLTYNTQSESEAISLTNERLYKDQINFKEISTDISVVKDKYSYTDLIVSDKDPRLALDSKCYVSYSPNTLINDINLNNALEGLLVKIHPGERDPFEIGFGGGLTTIRFSCIVLE